MGARGQHACAGGSVGSRAAPAATTSRFGGGVTRWMLSLNGQLGQAQAMVTPTHVAGAVETSPCRGISVQKNRILCHAAARQQANDNSFGSGGAP